MVTDKQVEAAQDAYRAHVVEHGVDGSTEAMRAALEAAERAAWEPIETAPKGTALAYGSGPEILGLVIGYGWSSCRTVKWEWHSRGKTGSWKADGRVWTPDFWRPLPPAPETAK